MREHSCPICGFACDCDANAAYNIRSRGFTEVGVVHSESMPAETTLPVDTVVSAKLVTETGSAILSEAVRPTSGVVHLLIARSGSLPILS